MEEKEKEVKEIVLNQFGKEPIGRYADRARQWAMGPEVNPRVERLLNSGKFRRGPGGSWQQLSKGKWITPNDKILNLLNQHQEAIDNPSRARRAQAFLKRPGVRAVTRPVGKAFTADLAGYGAEAASGLLGASPETSSRIGSGVTGATASGMALTGLRALAAAPPAGPVGVGAKVVGNVGLAAYSLYNLWDSFMGDE